MPCDVAVGVASGDPFRDVGGHEGGTDSVEVDVGKDGPHVVLVWAYVQHVGTDLRDETGVGNGTHAQKHDCPVLVVTSHSYDITIESYAMMVISRHDGNEKEVLILNMRSFAGIDFCVVGFPQESDRIRD